MIEDLQRTQEKPPWMSGPLDTYKRLALEGKLEVWSQEGGQMSPCIIVGGKDLAKSIEALVGGTGKAIPNYWRITVIELFDGGDYP